MMPIFALMPDMTSEPFWKTKTLEAMSESEWESLCDGCGRCCLVKLEDEDTGKIHFTDVRCTLLDAASCRCSDYPNRQKKVSDCVKLTVNEARNLRWLPPSCAYRIVAKGGDLPAWHPLVSGRSESVVKAGISVKGRTTASEEDVQLADLVDHIVSWPMRVPKRAKSFAG
jgi:uncharacterized protein